MSILNGLLGNASETNVDTVEKELSEILIQGEKVEHAYKLVRDLIVFTSKRLLLVDKQGMSGKKVEYHSIPYSSILHFSVETAGSMMDLDAELKIFISGSAEPIQKRFNKSLNIFKVQQVLATYTLK
ncbi:MULTISPECIES: PH domain-containing protein [unclassified Psychrobacillus]|uniref:PH domain-containing protein n=1 Tax=unclassified Psychrobacillus TaxID=2636677 RepID=UPI00146C0FC4|nr:MULTISPECIES: PH domain-containing protein [unclassified Psychrobacillus]MCM3357552.1 PH domain-containing protein [Psychrobacillus sp. MER TA 171]NME04727.1 PH domain-containing protein [Psychrobacillus sp. BL-248-WT-3]